MQNLLVIGVGYVGLVSGACFAEMGNRVVCLDKNKEKIENLREGIIPIYEPGLQEIVVKNSRSGRLEFTTEYQKAVETAEIILLCVDTPMKEDASCDLSSILAAAGDVARHINDYKVIVTKSTVPVNTAEVIRKRVQEVLDERGVDVQFDVVSNPEFLKEGAAVHDFMKPDRVIIGVDSERARKKMRELYRPFMLSNDRLIEMDTASSELSKYASNTMLALRISFMNWMASLCEEMGANILDVRKAVGSDSRIGKAFLWAGVGFGGSCFPKDIMALKVMAESCGLPADFIDAIEKTNEAQKESLVTKIDHYFQTRGGVKGKTFALLGLSFKPDTDDIRKAPSLVIIEKLLERGANLQLFDPIAMKNVEKELGPCEQIQYASDEYEAARGADALLLITEWKQFRLLDCKKVLASMKGKGFFDGRNQYIPQEMAAIGFDYFSVGRAPAYASLVQAFTEEKVFS